MKLNTKQLYNHKMFYHEKWGWIDQYDSIYQELYESDKYYTRLITTQLHEVNGFLISADKEQYVFEHFMPKRMFEEFVMLWHSADITKDEFVETCRENMCTDWGKQDIDGNCFDGYWKYEEGSFEKENAWNLSKEYAIYYLSTLPYPYTVLLKTIEIGCNNRRESVAYSNFIADWVYRKYKQVYGQNLSLSPPRCENILNIDEFAESYITHDYEIENTKYLALEKQVG